jgi:hypothetical protein
MRDTRDQWSTLARVTGFVGLFGVVALSVPMAAVASAGEPGFEATAAQALTFFRDAQVGWVRPVAPLAGLAMLAILWFVVGITKLLGRAEGDPHWRSTIALVSGVILAVYGILDSSWDAASHAASGLDQPVALYAFYAGNLELANAWFAAGSFIGCCGWVQLRTGMLPRWLGWWAVVSGIGLVLCRFVWTLEFWVVPYAMFWIWVVVVCVLLLRRPAITSRTADRQDSNQGTSNRDLPSDQAGAGGEVT